MRTSKPGVPEEIKASSSHTDTLKQGAANTHTAILDARPEAVQLAGLQSRMGESRRVKDLQAMQANMHAGAMARQPAATNNANHQKGLVSSQQVDNYTNSDVIQRVLHHGSTKRSKVFADVSEVPKKIKNHYDDDDIEDYIASTDHYGWFDKDKKIEKIKEAVIKKRKRVDSSTGSTASSTPSGEFTGWMKSVDEGVTEKNTDSSLTFTFKARVIKDQGKGGFNIGINNMADIDELSNTSDVEMTENQQGLNFFANHLMQQGLHVDPEGKDKDEIKKKRESKKRKVGPEIQQVIGEDKSGGLRAYYGGNLKSSQTFLRGELLPSKKTKKAKYTLKDYHNDKYRKITIAKAIEEIEEIISSDSLGGEISSMVKNGKSNKEISEFLKSKIGDRYKDARLRYLYKLRNALRASYGSHLLEQAEIFVPDNDKEIHAESNLLEVVINDLKAIFDVIGTKVPCVACFAKFCANNQQAHLLQYTSSIWFSEPCMSQLGCDYSNQSMVEVVNYLTQIDNNLKGVVGSIKRYTGHQGNIKQTFDDDDSGSEGEEARDEIIDSYRN